jgi:hypothetical protein
MPALARPASLTFCSLIWAKFPAELNFRAFERMRAAKIIAAVTLAILMGSTPGSSWSAPPAKVQAVRACLPAPVISLLGSSGATGIVLISSNGCR